MQKQTYRGKSIPLILRMILGLVLALASFTGAFLLICIVLARAMQRKELRDRIRHFNKYKLNPVTLRIAGERSRIYARIKHVGRRSGQQYSTPVVARPLGDGFVIPLPYGTDVDWCRNIMAAGACTLSWNEHDYTLEKPEIVPVAKALNAFPLVQEIIFSAGGLQQCLLLHQKKESIEKVRSDDAVTSTEKTQENVLSGI